MAGEAVSAHLEFHGGVTATVLYQRMPVVNSLGHALEILGTKGRVLFNATRGAWLLEDAWSLPDGDPDAWQPLDAETPESFDPIGSAALDDYWFVEEYVDALDHEREHESSGEEARHVLEIIMGIFESAAYERPVELPQAKRDHPLLRWRRENGLGDPKPMPRPYYDWLEAEDERLGRRARA